LILATLKIPATAPFFADHFPRRPVFPATLLLNSQIGLAAQLAREASFAGDGSAFAASRMTHVKMRAFIVPGQELESRVELLGIEDGTTRVALSARDADGKIIATARVEFTGAAP
jgi:3-hydroxymyristoyl/3-hydroxydecanoyl-(acyl carrier protein) dehydratase